MLTFNKWLEEWKIDSDYEPTEKEVDAMRDAWNGAIQTMKEAAEQQCSEDLPNRCPSCEKLTVYSSSCHNALCLSTIR